MKRWLLSLLTAFSLVSLTGCGYNDFQRLDESSKSAWSEVLNQYQRRADLVPNIVATVKGEAAFEQDTLTRVVEARAKATSIQVTPETLNNPEAFAKFQQAQGELSSALESCACACWNCCIFCASFSMSGETWIDVALARASMTFINVSCSKLASPLTVATRLGTRSARRWYWLSTSLQADLLDSSRRWKSL